VAEPAGTARVEQYASPSAYVEPLVAPIGRSGFLRLFGSRQFFRLWLGQIVSSLGDWIGLIAITALAARIGGSGAGAAVGLVLSARLIPGFFLAPVVGVLIDRWDRRRLMVSCDIGRGIVLVFLPFVHTITGLFLASLLLELMTLMWSPAKEASVPNIVDKEFLPTANSLSLAAAYGTFPLGGAVFAILAGVAAWLGNHHALRPLQVSQERLAFWFDVGTFFVSAAMVATLRLPKRQRDGDESRRLRLADTVRDLRQGWHFIGTSPRVRAVIVGLATGLIGGGMVVPLGPIVATELMHAGNQGYGLFVTSLGTGVALGVIGVSVMQKRLPIERFFVLSLFVGGGALFGGASTSHLPITAVCVGVLGLAAGGVYVLGFTILQTNVDDELRGRIFATLYTLVRFCLLLALTVAPILSDLLDRLSSQLVGRHVSAGGFGIALPGVRLTLWLGGLIIVAAGVLAVRSLRAERVVGDTARADDGTSAGIAGAAVVDSDAPAGTEAADAAAADGDAATVADATDAAGSAGG
jgi:dTMP kinase